MIGIKFLPLFLLISISGCLQPNKCRDISNEEFSRIVYYSLESTKETSGNNMILGAYKAEELKDYYIDREIESYGGISGLMTFYNEQNKSILKVRLFNDCDIQWVDFRT